MNRMRCIACGDYADERPPLYNAPCSHGENHGCCFIEVDETGLAIRATHSLECDHCGGDAITKVVNWFADGEGERCATCGFPGHVSVDESGDELESTARWSMLDEPGVRCTDARCCECCEDCQSATGGICNKHGQPEPQEW